MVSIGRVHTAYFFNANNKKKPGIRNRNNDPANPDEIQEYCYSGAYFHVSVDFYGFKGDGKDGVAVGLNYIMLRKPGDRLDGRSTAESDFAEFAEDEDEDDGETEGNDDW